MKRSGGQRFAHSKARRIPARLSVCPIIGGPIEAGVPILLRYDGGAFVTPGYAESRGAISDAAFVRLTLEEQRLFDGSCPVYVFH